MLQLFYNTGSIVWFVGNVKYKGTNNEEEDETDKKDEPYTNFYNSIKEITKSTYIYKINPKIKINILRNSLFFLLSCSGTSHRSCSTRTCRVM